MLEFVTIPLKKGSYVDISGPILKYLDDVKQYGNSSDYERPITELQNLRQDFVDKIGDKNEKTLAIFHKYADQIVGLDLKLPLTENQIRIKFKWQDAFPGQRAKAQSFLVLASGIYEKVCALFNVAAMESAVAEQQQKLNTDEGLKQAAKLYQQASGIFTYLQTVVPSIFSGSESPNDLRPETLNALAMMMLAHAQDVFIKKAMNDNMKPSLLAKLCQQCSFLYEESLKILQENYLKTLLPREWSALASLKRAAFQSLAYYHDGLNFRDNKKHGDAVARLNQAKAMMSKCAANSPIRPFPLAAQLKLVETEAAKAEKDNSFIFHDIIPNASTFPEIEKAILAKPTPVENSKFSPDFHDLLDRLLPLPIHQAVARCEERRMEIVQREISNLKNASQSLNNALVTMNLPASIEDAAGGKLPRSIAEKSSQVRSLGGYQHLERLVSDLPAMMQRCKAILDECERLLAEEEVVDRQIRMKYRYDWTRTPSDVLNGPIKEEIRKHRRVIQDALQADALVRQKFALNKNAVALLSENESDIERNLPPAVAALGSIKNQKFYKDLQQLLKQIEQLKEERAKLEERIRNAKIDASDKFMASFKKDGFVYEESVSMAEINRVFGSLRELVSRSIADQERIMKQVQTANWDFDQFKNQHANADSTARDAKLRELASAYDAYMELNGTTGEGNKFYGNFTLLLEKFQQTVREFCAERSREKDELMKEMPSTPTQGSTFVGYQPQTVFSTQMLYNAVPSTTLVTHGTPQHQSSVYFYPTAATSFNPYSVFLHR